jgi:REP element-mobilizing transposase RayT
MKDKDHVPVVFGALDRRADIEVTSRNLPHWFQVGAAIFVTFRAADSLPREVLLRMACELRDWLARNQLPLELANGMLEPKSPTYVQLIEQLNFSQQTEFKKLSNQLFHRSLDECHGACVLREPAVAKIVSDAFLKFEGDRYDLDSFVIMPNHVHVIVQFRPGFDLSLIGQSWMRYTARMINKQINRTGVFWQPEPFDHIVRSAEQFDYFHRYIAENPKIANLSAEEYTYWCRPM